MTTSEAPDDVATVRATGLRSGTRGITAILDADRGGETGRALRAEERLGQIEALTELSLADLSVEELLDELLERVRLILDVDTAAVLLLDRHAETLVATAARGLEEEVRQGVTVPLAAGFAGRIAADKAPVVIDHVDETTVVNPLLIAKGIRAMAGVPLVEAGEVVGVLHVGSLASRDFIAGDIELLQLVADRITGATGSRRAVIERDVTLALQRGLLPGRLPTISGLTTSARYVPGGGNAVGGDWYDLFPLPGGQAGIVIGDVSGHGLGAAIVMGRVRSALRAYAVDGASPETVLTRLDRKLQHFEAGAMATVAYGVLDPTYCRLRIACAGHLPPIVVDPQSGAARPMPLALDPPIGVASWRSRHVTEVELIPGSVLCFYTDGLVERRGEDLAGGIGRLAASVRLDDPAVVASKVMADLVGSTVLEDDVALLVLAIAEVDVGRPLEIRSPAEPDVLAGLRSAVRRWLAATPMASAAAEELLVAIGEATANSVEHAQGPSGGVFDLRLELDDDTVVATISDHGRWRPARGEHRGRGEILMRALCDQVDIQRGTAGTTVTLHKHIGGALP